MASSQHGRFVWYDIASADPQKSIAFYTHVIGWGTQISTQSDIPYTMLTAGEVPVAGTFPMREGMGGGPRWFAYIATDDMSRTLARARELGGQVGREPQSVGEAGSFAMLTDPKGVEFCLWQYSSDDEQPPADGVGSFSWHELATTDHEAAFAFYSDLFGWEKTGEYDMGEAGIYQMFGAGGGGMSSMFGGIYDQPAVTPTSRAWLNYIRIADLASAWDKALAAGATELVAPMEVPGGSHIAVALDPEKAAFGLHELRV
jgi:predicted enzyme related to lactoylglutathione lyase